MCDSHGCGITDPAGPGGLERGRRVTDIPLGSCPGSWRDAGAAAVRCGAMMKLTEMHHGTVGCERAEVERDIGVWNRDHDPRG